MIIMSYEDLVLLIALFLVTMVALVLIAVTAVYKVMAFRFASNVPVYPRGNTEEIKTFVNRT